MSIRVGVEIVTLEPAPAAVLARRTDWESFQRTALTGIQRVRRAVTAARVPTAGPPFLRYISLGPRVEVDIGLPLDGPHVVPSLRTTILPGGEAASLWHTGRPETLPTALEQLGQWVKQHGRPAGVPWQWYWTEPEAEEPRLQILWPIELR